MNLENNKILIIAGGTGGHVMPALAIACELMSQGIKVHWMGTQAGIETKLISPYDIPMHYIQINHFRGKGILGLIKAPIYILKAIVQSVKIIRTIKPQGVLSMGGYVSGPGSIAAWLCRCPLIIHEQNAVPGLTNRLLAPIASLIMTGFPKLFTQHAHKTKYTGNPVRLSILNLSAKTNNHLHLVRPLRLLILGGSLGAGILNEIIPQALSDVQLSIAPEVWHQTGEKQVEQTREAYKKRGITANVDSFIENMAHAYAWADCVICRSGALTIAELAAAGLASILVPFPAAADDHQTENAKYLTQHSAAILVPQSQLTISYMSGLLTELLEDSNKLRAMGMQAKSLAKPDATQDVVQYLLKGFYVCLN